jgi:hypothetical protein
MPGTEILERKMLQAEANQQYLRKLIDNGSTIYIKYNDGGLSELTFPSSTESPQKSDGAQALANQQYLRKLIDNGSTIYIKYNDGGLSELTIPKK